MVLRVKGIDYESLDHASRDHAVKRLEAALRAFDCARARRIRRYSKQTSLQSRVGNTPTPWSRRLSISGWLTLLPRPINCTRLMSIDRRRSGQLCEEHTLGSFRKVPTHMGGSLRDVLALFSR